ncbi:MULTISPECIES: hypothetical protein [Glaesserella]|uniref:Glycosyltransferase n=1 Tax=Glaesserella australis TaxID=2094024 RepID=A0A328C0I9_9PAST|nr:MULTISPECIES: hypothetical protein [Glaesserella]AUI66415.1 hypothetical protein CJD39_07380 [Glaesserella sp. 15-184]RAL19371.1 hypothetical protein C5N92_02685 [Glaesserella australis]
MAEHIFKMLKSMELDNDFLSVVNKSKELLDNKNFESIHAIIQSNMNRIIHGLHNRIYTYWDNPIPIYETSKTPLSYAVDTKDIIDVEKLPVIISLTTISGRLGRLHKTIESIKNQTAEIHSINLYISEEPFLLDVGINRNSDELANLHKLGVNIYSVPNTGPYRKQIPIIYQLKKNNASSLTPIVTIDDDVIYPNDIINRFLEVKEYAVVAHRGRCISLDNNSIGPYNTFYAPKDKKHYLNLGTGKNGILYRLGFFPDKISNYIGPLLIPTADDLWCKWITAFCCIPTVILEPEAAYNPELDFPESDPKDKNGLFHKFNNKGSNDISIKGLENYYNFVFGKNLFSIYSFK